MTKTGRCYLYKKTNSPVNGREFVLGMSPGTPKELAPGSTRVRASSWGVAARPWAPRVCKPANSRRPQREFAGLVTPTNQRTRAGIPPPCKGGIRRREFVVGVTDYD